MTAKITMVGLGITFLGDMALKMWFKDTTYKELGLIYPFVRSWSKHKSAEKVKSIVLENFITSESWMDGILTEPTDWAEYIKENKDDSAAKKFLKIMELSSGQKLSDILLSEHCMKLFR